MALEKIVKNSSGVPTGEYEEIAGGTLWADSPIGSIFPYGGADAPAGWMICDGTSLLRASYPELFAVIGTSFGSVDSTHFNIPDLRGKVPVGFDASQTEFDTLGETGGEKTHKLTINEMPSHTHAPNNGATTFDFSSSSKQPTQIAGDRAWTNLNIGYTGGNQAHNNLQPYNTVNFIIKAVQVALPADLASGVEEYINDNAKSPISSSNKLVTESDLNTVTSGNATRNTTYVSSTGFNATWNKTGRVCMASLTFNLAQNTTSTEEIITGFPAPIADVDIVAQGANNTTVSNLILKTNGNIRTHYGGTANQFYQVTFTYITA